MSLEPAIHDTTTMNAQQRLAFGSRQARQLAAELHSALTEGAEATTPEGLLLRACHIASAEGLPVEEFLAQEVREALATTCDSQAWARSARVEEAAIQAERNAALRGVPHSYFTRVAKLDRLRRQIADAERARDAASETYRKAGLTEAQITILKAGSPEQTEMLRAEAEQLADEVRRLGDFMADPTDRQVLAGIELYDLPSTSEGSRPE